MKKQEDDAHPIGGALDGGILKLIKKNMHGKIEGWVTCLSKHSPDPFH